MLKVEVVMLTSRGHPDPGAAPPLGDFDTGRHWHNRPGRRVGQRALGRPRHAGC